MGRQFFLGSFLLKLPIFVVLSISQSSYAQEYTQAEIERICGTKMEVSKSSSIQNFKNLSRQVAEENARIDACIKALFASQRANEARKEEMDAIPVGGRLPNATINGAPLRKCSHGGVCHGQMLEQIRTGSY